MDLLCDLNRARGQTFVLVTHDANIAARAHRTVYMVDGLIVDEKRRDGSDETC
jgi:putative ABC transport system ATP-binding protein